MLVVTHNETTYNQLALIWGINAKLCEKGGVFREDIDWLIEESEKEDKLAKGDKVLLILGRTPDEEQMQLIGIKQV
jgi:pyruvate kinase